MSELDGDPSACRNVGSGGWSLLAGYAAADRLQFQARVLCSIESSSYRFPNKRGHFDSALLDVEDDGSGFRHRSVRRRRG